MGIKQKNRHYLASALTSKGFISFWPERFKELKRLYLLQGNTISGQSLAIRLLGLALEDRSLHINYFHRAEDPMVLEGMIIPVKGFGVLSRDHPCAQLGSFPSLKVKTVELPGGSVQTKDCGALGNEKVGHLLNAAGEIRNSCCSGYGDPSDAGVMNKATGWIKEFQERESVLKHFFAGSVTVQGEVEFLHHLLKHCRKRYLLKGAPESGTKVMQEILIEALSCRYGVEAFHSWIDPMQRVALFFPELQVAVIDITCCYKDLFPLPDDVVWDLGGNTQTEACCQEAGRKVQKLKSFLTEAGRTADTSEEGKEGLYFTEDELDEIISQLLRDILSK
ncbi:MAG: hypothetical protein PHX16_09165 [Syntrophaceticus sp.]|nr:hypothetical protein [Syntrophaceticus sp.]MDD4360748.1 hypothetical protein [Syntrophaceticus sp.]MDD4783777.1 hypothetical protein [Syntrophaceticus sp.]